MTRIVCVGDMLAHEWAGLLAAALPGHEIIAHRSAAAAEPLPVLDSGTLVLLESAGDRAQFDARLSACAAAGAACVLIATEPGNQALQALAAIHRVPCIDLAAAVARHGYEAASLQDGSGRLTAVGNAVYAGLIRAGLAPLLSGRQPLTLVAAMARNRVIGNQGRLPWHEPADLAHFKRLTTGHAVIMGRKTWESLDRPLPRRRNLVVTRQTGFTPPGIEVHATLEGAIAAARITDPEPHIIGGGEIYALALPLATRIELTEIAAEPLGDAWFPKLGPGWIVALERAIGQCHFRTWVPRLA